MKKKQQQQTNKQINGKSIQKDKYHTDETQRDLAQESLNFRFAYDLNDGSQWQVILRKHPRGEMDVFAG